MDEVKCEGLTKNGLGVARKLCMMGLLCIVSVAVKFSYNMVKIHSVGQDVFALLLAKVFYDVDQLTTLKISQNVMSFSGLQSNTSSTRSQLNISGCSIKKGLN